MCEDTAPFASPATAKSLDTVSRTLTATNYEADAPCSVNAALTTSAFGLLVLKFLSLFTAAWASATFIASVMEMSLRIRPWWNMIHLSFFGCVVLMVVMRLSLLSEAAADQRSFKRIRNSGIATVYSGQIVSGSRGVFHFCKFWELSSQKLESCHSKPTLQKCNITFIPKIFPRVLRDVAPAWSRTPPKNSSMCLRRMGNVCCVGTYICVIDVLRDDGKSSHNSLLVFVRPEVPSASFAPRYARLKSVRQPSAHGNEGVSSCETSWFLNFCCLRRYKFSESSPSARSKSPDLPRSARKNKYHEYSRRAPFSPNS